MAGRGLCRRLAVAVLLVAGVASAQQAGLSLFAYLQNASPAVRARASKLIAEKHPLLPNDLARLIARERPDFYNEIRPDLDKLIAAKFPTLAQFVEAQISAAPEVQAAVDQFIGQRYPDLAADVAALEPGPDLAKRAADLVRAKYPDLDRDIVGLLYREHLPFMLNVQRKAQAQFPTFLAETGALILGKYPELDPKITELVTTKYPDLIPQLMGLMLGAVGPTEDPPEPVPPPQAPKPPQR